MAFTFFFRDRHTLERLTEQFVPAFKNATKLKVWDAGCAMGPEPYTFAIIMAEYMGDDYKKVKFIASDINETSNFKEIITDGIYPHSELSRMPEGVFKKYFKETEKEGYYKISDFILDSLEFHQHDLLSLEPIDTNFNAILCKNVLLHFHPDQRVEVIKMYHKVLVPGGYFCTEQTQQMPEQCKHLFEKVVSDANVYKKI
jgi:chemotaxis protein methyltransferase CheR